MRVFLHLTMIVLLVCHLALAGDAGREGPFSQGAGARSLGLGGANVALADDASTVFYNPAGLGMLDYQELSFTHAVLFEGTTFDMGSWVYPISERSGIGVGFMRIGTGDIIRRENYVDLGTFSYNHWQFLLDFGRRIHRAVSLGATLKIASQSIDNLSDYGIGADAGIKVRLYRELSFGASIRNALAPEYRLASVNEATPMCATGGLAVSNLHFGPNWTITIGLDLEKYEDRSAKLHAGAELMVSNRFALRAGYDRENVALGTGVQIGHFKIDYAYRAMDHVEDAHRVSLGILIGESISQQRLKRELEEQQRGRSLLESERLRQFQVVRHQADEYYQQLRLDSALTYYQRALAFDPANQEVIGTIAAIESIQRIQEEEERKIREGQAEQERSITTYYNQAVAFFEKQYYPAARDMVNLVLEINPDHQPSRDLLTRIHVALTQELESARQRARNAEQSGHTVAAIEAYNRILELQPDNAAIRQSRAQAIASLDLAQQLNLGIDMYNKGRFAEAQVQFQAVLKSDPNNAVAKEYLSRGGSLPATPASPTLEDLQRDPEIWPIYLDGLRHMRAKEYAKAIDSWEKVLKAYPNNSSTIENIRQARLRMESESGQK